MHNFLARFSVKTKIIGGFSLILSILLLVAVFVFIGSRHVESQIKHVINNTIPLQRKAMLLKEVVNESGSNLGFYLLGKDIKLWNDFENNLQHAKELIAEIKLELEMVSVSPDGAEENQQAGLGDLALINEVSVLIEKYEAKKTVLKKTATDYSFNMLGLKMTLDDLGPLNSAIFSEISKMRISEDEEEYSEDRKQVLAAINNLHILSLRLTNEIRLYLAFRFPVSIINIKDRKKQIITQLSGFSQLLEEEELTLEQEEAVLQLKSSFDQYFPILDNVLVIHGGDRWRKDTYFVRKVITPLVNKINTKIDVFVERKTDDLNIKTTDVIVKIEESSIVVLVLSFTGVFIGILIAWFITAHIIKRIGVAVDALVHIADGGGNLNTRLEDHGKDEMSLLSSSFNKFVTKIGHIVDLVILSSKSLSDEATRMLEVTTTTQEGVVSQQGEIASISIAIKEMTNTVENIASNSSQAAQTASDATQEAKVGQKVVKESVEAIHQLANEVENAVEVIKRVDKESEDISIVVSVIRDISDQTNLLALNAAIEAARAGEHGRGFAVVADEVRNLSNKIQSQTSLIIDRIEKLQVGARDAVVVMTKGFETAKHSVDLSNQAGDALQLITDSVVNISGVSASIAESTEIQSKVAKDILDNISVISGIAEQTSDGAKATKQSATEFRSMSAQLQGLVEQFLLDETSGVLDASKDGGVQIGENQEEEDIFF